MASTSTRDDSPRLHMPSPKAASNGKKEMAQKQPLDFDHVFQYRHGEQILVNTEFGMWPGIFESYFDGNPEMIRYSLFLRKMEKKIFIIQQNSIFPFPLEKIEAAIEQNNSSEELMEALRNALVYGRERIAKNAESSKRKNPAAIARTIKETQIKQELATPEKNIRETPSVTAMKQKTLTSASASGRLSGKRKIIQDDPKPIVSTATDSQSSMVRIQPAEKRHKLNSQIQDEEETELEHKFVFPDRGSPSEISSPSISISMSTASQDFGALSSAFDLQPLQTLHFPIHSQPLLNINQPPSMLTFFTHQPPPMIDQSGFEMRSKAEIYAVQLQAINTIKDLNEYIWRQGYDTIPLTEPQLLFNDVLQKRSGLIGASMLYQIKCYEHPELETYYCEVCKYWTTTSEMFIHLQAPRHQLNYMFRNYKMYYRIAIKEADGQKRDMMLHNFSNKIWQVEDCGQCTKRMRCILNEESIRRIWPDYINCLDNSWKIMDEADIELYNAYYPYKIPSTTNEHDHTNSHSRPNSVHQWNQQDSTQPHSQSQLLEQKSVVASASFGASVGKKLETSENVGDIKHQEREEDEWEKLQKEKQRAKGNKRENRRSRSPPKPRSRARTLQSRSKSRSSASKTQSKENVEERQKGSGRRSRSRSREGRHSRRAKSRSSSRKVGSSRLHFASIPMEIVTMEGAEHEIRLWLARQEVKPRSIVDVNVPGRFHNPYFYANDPLDGFFYVQFGTVDDADDTRRRLNNKYLYFDDIEICPAITYAKPRKGGASRDE